MTAAKSFKVRLKDVNREFLEQSKPRLRVRSAAAALNRILDLARVRAGTPTMFVITCPKCNDPVLGISLNDYACCPHCNIVFSMDKSVSYLTLRTTPRFHARRAI